MSRFPAFCLPFRPALKASMHPEEIIDDEGNTTVLVVEDSPETLQLLTLLLKASGYRVIAAQDGLDALRSFECQRPDLVILDLDLPTVSGFRLMQLFRRSQPPSTVPVVVVTGYDYEEAEEVAQAGAADLITKPFDVEDFLGRVDFALHRARCGTWIPNRPDPVVARNDSAQSVMGQVHLEAVP